MAERDPQIDERVRQLEREVRRVSALLSRGAADREAVTKLPRNPCLAKTCAEEYGGSYPDLDEVPNTYWIKFLDSTFTLAEGDQTPTHTERQTDGATLAHVLDGAQDYLAEDTVVVVTFDNGRWWILHTISGRRWAKAVLNVAGPATDGDWEENSGEPRVYCKVCDRDGTNVRGDGFWIALPRLRAEGTDYDPEVFVGDVIPWEIDIEGTAFSKYGYRGSKIGDLRWQKSDAKIRTGWRDTDGVDGAWDVKHRVLMGRDAGGETNENAAGNTGGFRWHGTDGPDEADNNHPDHPQHEHEGVKEDGCFDAVAAGSGIVNVGPAHNVDMVDADFDTAEVWDWNAPSSAAQKIGDAGVVDLLNHKGPFNTDADTDNRMPFKVAILLERYK